MDNDEPIIDFLQEDLPIITSLNNYGVRYLIVGGYAMLFHGGADRPVNDLDIWIDGKEENAHKCWKALNAIMPNSLNFSPNHLTIGRRKIDLRANRYDVDIFMLMEGAEFELAFSRCGNYTKNGELLYFVGAQDHLAIKREARKTFLERIEKETRDINFLEKIFHE